MPKRLYDAERYEVLAAVYAKAGTEVMHDMVGAYRTKTVRAGEFLYVSCYPLIGAEAHTKQEQAMRELAEDKRVKTAAKYVRYNNARRLREFEMLCAANFGAGDYHVVCTYAPPEYGMPQGEEEYRSREDACREIRNYIRRVKRLLKRRGCDVNEFRWVLVTSTKERDPEARNAFSPAHHHHMLMHGIPEILRGEVERLWGFGYCDADRLQPDDKGIAAMAGYVARQEGTGSGERSRGERSFTASRNIIRPTVTTSDRKISRRRIAQIASDVRANGTEVFAKVYPEYRLVEEPKVSVSDFTAGAYIRAKLRAIDVQKRKGGL
jgi:hypothetical protein